MVSKQEILGKQILKRIHIHNKNDGGVFTETTGSQGSAKTSVLLSFTDYTLTHHPDEKVFWSECYRSPLQVFKLGVENVCFLAKNDIPLVFRDRDNKHTPIKIPVIRFKDFNELYNKAKPGKVNVVFFGNRYIWMDFIDYLRNVGEWVHVYIDEMSEVCPSYSSGDMWKRIGRFSLYILKDIRKDMINLHVNTQSKINVDDRVRKQIMIKIFLPGAISDKHSRITQRAIDNLIRNPIYGNQAYLDYSGQFGVITFKDIYKPQDNLHIDAVCNGGEGEMSFIPSFKVVKNE
jgi:hypothetical protein